MLKAHASQYQHDGCAVQLGFTLMIISRNAWAFVAHSSYGLMRPSNFTVAAMLLLGIGHSTAFSQSEGVACTYQGYIGSFDFFLDGETASVFTEGTTAYISFYNDVFTGVSVMDVNDPLWVVGLGGVSIENMQSLFVENSLAYVGHDDTTLDIYNMSVPSAIELVGMTQLSFQAMDFESQGDLLYTHDESHGLSIIDVSDPSNPDEIGTYETAESIRDISVFGDTLFLLLSGKQLEIVDVVDPTSPVPIGVYGTGELIQRFAQTDGALIYLVGNGFIEVVDVSVADSPIQANIVSIDALLDGFVFESLADVRLVGDVLYLLYEEGGLFEIDFSDTAEPMLIGQIDSHGYGSKFDIEDGIAYIAELSHGLAFVDLKELNTSSSQVGMINGLGGYLRRVTVVDDIAYVTDLGDGLFIYDVSDPSQPVYLTGYSVQSETLLATSINNGIAYLAAGESGLHIVDVSDPANPDLLVVYNSLGDVANVVVDGDLACLMTSNEVFIFLDISNPASPTLEGILSFDFNINHESLALSENTLYLSSSDFANAKLIAADLTDPVFPLIDTEEICSPLNRIAIDGEYLYGINNDSSPSLSIFERVGLRFRGYSDAATNAVSITVSNGRAYIGDSKQLMILNVEQPSNPFLIGTVETRSPILDISIDGSMAYLASQDFGLDIIDVSENCTICAADFDGDGSLDFMDISAFIALFSAHDPRSDLTGDGRFNFFDVSAFLSAFSAGC
jgi:hypothetical protein